jgi:hypothetical protein
MPFLCLRGILQSCGKAHSPYLGFRHNHTVAVRQAVRAGPRLPEEDRVMKSTDQPFALAPDFELLFQATPMPYLILQPDLTIIAVNDAYLSATLTTRQHLLGRYMFDAFPDNPADPKATGVSNLRASLNWVLEHKAPHRMAIQKYDIPIRDSRNGEFEERYWSPLNSPVLSRTGELAYIIHQVEDVTEQTRKQHAAEAGEARFRQIC